MKKLITILLMIVLVGGTSKQESLYDSKTKYVGDNSKVVNIVSHLDYKNTNHKSIEIKSQSEPFGLSVYLDSKKIDKDELKKPAILTFALIGNLENLEYISSDKEEVVKFNRTSLNQELINNGEKSIDQIGETKENFETFEK